MGLCTEVVIGFKEGPSGHWHGPAVNTHIKHNVHVCTDKQQMNSCGHTGPLAACLATEALGVTGDGFTLLPHTILK